MSINETCANKSDEEIVALAIANQEYLICIINRYEKKLSRYIARISGLSKEDIEDLLQDIFIKVYLNLNEFNFTFKSSSWIYRIARNETISSYRRRQTRPKIIFFEDDNKILENIPAEFDLKKELEKKELSSLLKTAINALDEKYQEILMLRFFEDKDYTEISDILQKPMGSVASLLNRAKAQLKNQIKQYE